MSTFIPFRDKHRRKQRLEILFEDTHLLVVDKRAGLRVIPDRWDPNLPNLRDLLQAHYGRIREKKEARVWITHRIDADTSGLVMVARTPAAHRQLNALFEQGRISKTYLAISRGVPPADSGEIDLPLRPHPTKKPLMQVHSGGKISRTRYRVVETFRHYSVLELSPLTGRTHQIRVHLQALGSPLAVDPLYGDCEALYLAAFKPRYRPRGGKRGERPLMGRLTLHAFRLEFDDPLTHQSRRFEAPPPKDFSALLKALRKWNSF